MSKEIVNRVQKSGIITIDMDDIELPKKNIRARYQMLVK